MVSSIKKNNVLWTPIAFHSVSFTQITVRFLFDVDLCDGISSTLEVFEFFRLSCFGVKRLSDVLRNPVLPVEIVKRAC